MEKIVALRFSPFNFSIVLGFPNVVPTMDEWGDYFPIFRGHVEDNPAQHLCEFHELMHQWDIHHEDVLLKMFMFSLEGGAHEWYHSLPPTSISSLREFHATFSRHYQRHYFSGLIDHNCCEEYEGHDQDVAMSYESWEDEDHEEEDALDELIELVEYLSTEIEELKADHDCCLFEENTEDFLVLEAFVLSGPTDEGSIEYSMVVETSVSAPHNLVVSVLKKQAIVEEDSSLFLHEISHDVFTFGTEKKDWEIIPLWYVVPRFDDYSNEEQQSPTSQFTDQRSNQPVYDSYESSSELDVQDFQEQTIGPYPLFIKKDYLEEIIPPRPAEDTEQQDEEKRFMTGPVYDYYESDPWESQEEEPEEQQKEQFISCPEPVGEEPSLEISQHASSSHPLMPTSHIQPYMSNDGT
jgi:hypothetical protein